MTLKKAFRCWLMLFCAFLACGSAASVGDGFCFRWNGVRGNVECHQAMVADQPGQESAAEQERLTLIVRTLDLDTPAVVKVDESRQEPNPDELIARHFGTDHRELRPLDFEQIADFNLNLSVLIAQDHGDSSGASFGIRSHGESHVLTPGECRNRISPTLGALPVNFPISGTAAAFHRALSLTLQSALYCASPFLDYRSMRQKHIQPYRADPRNPSPRFRYYEPGRMVNGGLPQRSL